MAIKVFLADDHLVVRDGLRALLEADKNINVIGDAANGLETVRMVQELCPDIVIMDISMPELNGIAATRQILENSPSTGILILSMHSSKEHIIRAMRAGAKGYLLKESAGQEVLKAVKSVYSGTLYLSQRITDVVINDYAHLQKGNIEQSPFDLLSLREKEVLQLVVEGKSSAAIAKIILLSPKTVETYRSRLMQKLGIRDLPGLVKFAIKHGLTSIYD